MPEGGWIVERVVTSSLIGELYIPRSEGKAAKRPALVIMPSSAGVCDVRERFYAAFFAERGCLCLIADTFARRGLTQCMTDQSLLSEEEMLTDARSAFIWLAMREDVERIGIFGVSKGGLAALNAAMSPMPGMPPAPGIFGLHVCLSPPCNIQLRYPQVTGAPILMLLGGKDDYTGAAPALSYAERINACNHVDIERVIFPDARHAWESCGEPRYYPRAERCERLFYLEDDGSITDAASGENMSAAVFRQRRKIFASYGAHAGGGTDALLQRTCDTILDFMRRHDFLPAQD